VKIPAGLEWWRSDVHGATWLDRLPRLVAECVEQWSLKLDAPFEPMHTSFVTRVELADGTKAVLKINFPESETEREADALACWDGDGAVRLLRHDSSRRALVIERCEPGGRLWDVPEEDAIRIAAGVLHCLWKRAPAEHPFSLLADEAAVWCAYVAERWERQGRPFERTLLEEATSFATEAASSQGELVVLHQDFHGGNVLQAERRPWLAIDAKPLVGEREFDTASLVRDRREALARDPNPRATIRRRLDYLADELALDRERMRGWGIVHGLAWGVRPDHVMEDMLACARWLAELR
jgi:streptomycin 6-kinase